MPVISMGIFSFFANWFNSNNGCVNQGSSVTTNFQNRLYNKSLFIASIVNRGVVVIAIIKNGKLLYNNFYTDSSYEYDNDGDIKFRGPVFKIELSLRNGDHFDIFYGVVTDDRQGLMMDVRDSPSMLDNYTINTLKEIQSKCPGIYDLSLFENAPTRYAYHLYKNSTFYVMTNNFGTDAYFINFKTGEYRNGNRDEIYKFIGTLTIEKEPTIEYFSSSSKSSCYNKIQGEIKVNNIVNFGSYYFDDAVHKVPIQWRILAIEAKKALLISEYAIECQAYHTSSENFITWENSDLRKWMNTVFYSEAFSNEEQSQICLSHLKNPDNDYGRNCVAGGNDTNCKVFLLSIDEATSYFSNDEARCCKLTKYAESIYKSQYSKCKNDVVFCNWRLRSPGYEHNTAAAVSPDGLVASGGDYVWTKDEYIRPAIWVNIKK